MRSRTTPGSGRAGAAVLATLLLLSAPGGAAGQELVGPPLPAWTEAWSPLGGVAAGPRTLPAPAPGFGLLTAPEPRTGGFWTGGNPASLRREIGDAWTSARATRRAANGDYRRPLDPSSERDRRLEALSWKPVGGWGAAIGRVRAADLRREPGSRADALAPYRGTPFVLTDTAEVRTRVVLAQLEGAVSVDLGAWSVGAGGGYRVTTNRTRESPLPRFGDRVTAGAVLGVDRALAGGDLRVGAYARVRSRIEEMSLNALAGPGRAYPLQGLSPPTPVDLAPGENPSVFRRSERLGRAAGLVADGALGEWRWTLAAERGRADETHANRPRAEAADSVFQRWEPAETRARAALQRRFGEILLTARGGWSRRSGDATVPDVGEVVYEELTGRAAASVGVRARPDGEWTLATRLGLIRETRERTDRLSGLLTDLVLWRQQWSAGAARRLTGRLSAGVEYGLAVHDATGSMPRPEQFEGYLQEAVLPELLLYATPSATHSGSLALRWRAGAGTRVWVRARAVTLSPGETGRVLARRPDGTRTEWGLTVGVTLE